MQILNGINAIPATIKLMATDDSPCQKRSPAAINRISDPIGENCRIFLMASGITAVSPQAMPLITELFIPASAKMPEMPKMDSIYLN